MTQQQEVMDTFPELYEGYKKPKAVELGLELAEVETIYSKYGLRIYPDSNNFHKSLNSFFEKTGFLSPKQLNALRNSRT